MGKLKICEITKVNGMNTPSAGEFIRWFALNRKKGIHYDKHTNAKTI